MNSKGDLSHDQTKTPEEQASSAAVKKPKPKAKARPTTALLFEELGDIQNRFSEARREQASQGAILASLRNLFLKSKVHDDKFMGDLFSHVCRTNDIMETMVRQHHETQSLLERLLAVAVGCQEKMSVNESGCSDAHASDVSDRQPLDSEAVGCPSSKAGTAVSELQLEEDGGDYERSEESGLTIARVRASMRALEGTPLGLSQSLPKRQVEDVGQEQRCSKEEWIRKTKVSNG